MQSTGFLTAVLQNHARKVGISIDSLEFNFHVKKPHLEIQELKRKNIYLVIHDAAFGVSVDLYKLTSLVCRNAASLFCGRESCGCML